MSRMTLRPSAIAAMAVSAGTAQHTAVQDASPDQSANQRTSQNESAGLVLHRQKKVQETTRTAQP